MEGSRMNFQEIAMLVVELFFHTTWSFWCSGILVVGIVTNVIFVSLAKLTSRNGAPFWTTPAPVMMLLADDANTIHSQINMSISTSNVFRENIFLGTLHLKKITKFMYYDTVRVHKEKQLLPLKRVFHYMITIYTIINYVVWMGSVAANLNSSQAILFALTPHRFRIVWFPWNCYHTLCSDHLVFLVRNDCFTVYWYTAGVTPQLHLLCWYMICVTSGYSNAFSQIIMVYCYLYKSQF